MTRRPKRRNPAGGRGPRKAQPGKLQADHTLVDVLFKILALPAGSVHLVDDRYLVSSPETWVLLDQMQARLVELGGDGRQHIDNALRMLQQGGRA